MGNSLGWKKTSKVMTINGETFKLKSPVTAEEVVKDYPGHVLLESEAVKHYGIRAKPLQPHQKLEPKRLYFLVELPEAPKESVPRRVRSGINMSAKDRLESLMLSRRSISDLTLMKPVKSVIPEVPEEEEKEGSESGAMRVQMRLPKAEVERLMKESKNEAEAASKIMQLCMANTRNGPREATQNGKDAKFMQQQVRWTDRHGSVGQGFKAREKKVSFLPISEGRSQIAVTS